MKPIGIARKLDKQGRIFIPIELREKMKIENDDSIQLYVDGGNVILKKYEPTCSFGCNSVHRTNVKDKIICIKCIEALK